MAQRDPARELEGDQPAGGQHAHELGDVGEHGGAVGHVLEHDVAVDQVERGVGELAQLVAVVEHEAHAAGPLRERSRLVQHRLGDVHADALVEVGGERLGQAADAAAEVERRAVLERVAESAGAAHERAHATLAGAQQLVGIPASEALLGVRHHRPVGIDAGQVLPVAAVLDEGHGARL